MARVTALKAKTDEIEAQAKAKGLENNYFYKTTLKRYKTQLRILEDLEKAIEEYGATVTKEYVKGRQNLMSNPAITEYNKTATAANGTVATLINIIKSVPAEQQTDDALSEFLDE